MPDLVLHHHDGSPYSEKIRLISGHERLAWRAVTRPAVMPKPHLVPLAGGYRRMPVLQIGADVYCDSQLIVRMREQLYPSPTLHSGAPRGAPMWRSPTRRSPTGGESSWATRPGSAVRLLPPALVPGRDAAHGGSLR